MRSGGERGFLARGGGFFGGGGWSGFSGEANARVAVARVPELPAVGVVGVGGGDLRGYLLGAEHDAAEGVVTEGLEPGAQFERVDVGALDAFVERELDGLVDVVGGCHWFHVAGDAVGEAGGVEHGADVIDLVDEMV